MRCPHQAPGVCASCWSRQEAVERLARRLDRDSTMLHAQVDAWDAEVGPQPERGRAGQPLGLHGHERIVLVATVVVALLVLLDNLPPWALLLVVLSAVASLIRTQGRLLDALLRAVRSFVKGPPNRVG
jgi:hypothetical protein